MVKKDHIWFNFGQTFETNYVSPCDARNLCLKVFTENRHRKSQAVTEFLRLTVKKRT